MAFHINYDSKNLKNLNAEQLAELEKSIENINKFGFRSPTLGVTTLVDNESVMNIAALASACTPQAFVINFGNQQDIVVDDDGSGDLITGDLIIINNAFVDYLNPRQGYALLLHEEAHTIDPLMGSANIAASVAGINFIADIEREYFADDRAVQHGFGKDLKEALYIIRCCLEAEGIYDDQLDKRLARLGAMGF